MAQCKAKSKRSGERCRRYAMKGKAVCSMHGGKSKGAAKNNKNALKTGQRETITFETMTPKEFESIKAMEINPVVILEGQLKILCIRELRIMKRMKEILDTELLAGQSNDLSEKDLEMVAISGSEIEIEKGGAIVTMSTTTNKETFTLNYLRLDNALTAIQGAIVKTVERLVSIKALIGDDKDEPITKIEFVVVSARKPQKTEEV